MPPEYLDAVRKRTMFCDFSECPGYPNRIPMSETTYGHDLHEECYEEMWRD